MLLLYILSDDSLQMICVFILCCLLSKRKTDPKGYSETGTVTIGSHNSMLIRIKPAGDLVTRNTLWPNAIWYFETSIF